MAYNSRLDDLVKRARRIRIHRTPLFQKYLKLAVSQSPLEAGLDMLEEIIALFEVRVSKFSVPVPFTPPSTDITGPLKLGITFPHKVEVGITAAELSRILLVLGRIGSGKTSLASRIVLQLPRNQGAIVFDKFGELEWCAAVRKDIVYLPYEYFFHSVFEAPPGTDPEKFLRRSSETLAIETGLFSGSEGPLARELIGLHRKGVNREGPRYTSTLGEVIEHLYRLRVEYEERKYIVRVRDRLENLYLSLGNTLNARRSCLPHLLNRIVIVNLRGMDAGDIFVFVSQVLVWLETYFEQFGKPDRPLQYTVLVDEAHHLLSATHAHLTAGESSFTSRILDCRGRGIGLILMSQIGMALNPIARSQAATRLYFALGSPDDAHEAARYLWGNNATDDEERSLLNLPPGYCYIKHPRNPEAHLLKIRYADPCRFPYHPQLLHLRAAMHLYLAGFRPQPGPTPSRWQEPDGEQPSAGEPGSQHSDEQKERPDQVSVDSDRFIKQVALAPFCTVKEIRDLMKLGGSTYDRIRRELAGRSDLIVFIQLATGQPGRAPQWAKLTPAGFTYAGVKPPPELDHDSNQALHSFWKRRVHDFLVAKGTYVHVYLDREIGGKKKIDAAGVTPDGELHAYEIELQPDLRHLLQNIKLDFEAGATQVTILVPEKEMITKAKVMIAQGIPDENTRSKITIQPVGTCLERE